MTRRPSCANSSTTSAAVPSMHGSDIADGRSRFDDALWRNLEDTGLARLTSTPDLGAGRPNSRSCFADWPGTPAPSRSPKPICSPPGSAPKAGLTLPDAGRLTVAIADADSQRRPDQRHRDRRAVDAGVVRNRVGGPHIRGALRRFGTCRGRGDRGRPQSRRRATRPSQLRPTRRAVLRRTIPSVHAELLRRGAWARCVQIIGAMDAAAELSVAHTRERVQFGRPLSKFQSVQHALAAMAGEIERARAATTMAVAAASDHGFAATQTDYAVTVAKVVLGRVVRPRHHDRPSAPRRDRRDRRTPTLAGHDAGTELGQPNSAAPHTMPADWAAWR